jgi:hypothetical protein
MKNIFIKSMLRQPWRTALIMVLVAVAAFAFVLRAEERRIISAHIHELAGYYRTVGFIIAPYGERNIFRGAELVRQSPYLAFYDIRRAAAGIMQDFPNTDMIGLSPHNPFRETDAFFYAFIYNITPRNGGFLDVFLRVGEVVQGFPEHALEGQAMLLRYYVPDSLLELFVGRIPEREEVIPYTSLAQMNIGGWYFLRGMYYERRGASVIVPRPGFRLNPIIMIPVNTNVGEIPIWFVAVDGDGEMDFSAPGLEGLPQEIERIRYNQHTIELRTTRDMYSVPFMHPNFPLFNLREGRLLNHDDYLNANPVIAVNWLFALRRGLEVGDTIVVDIPVEHHVIGRIHGVGFAEQVLAATQGEYAGTLELEVVGTFRLLDIRVRYLTTTHIVAYIPESVLPREVRLEPWYGTDFLPDEWFSFQLADTRTEYAFHQAYAPILSNMGYTLHLIPANAENFWISAESILQSVNFYFIMFSILSVSILGHVVFIFVFARRKEAYTMWALGCNRWKVRARLVICLVVFALPAAGLGAVAARPFGQQAAESTIESAFDDLGGC